jgi:Flp pilus assembly pilin Flp
MAKETAVKTLFRRIGTLIHNQRGATAIEYALIATGIFLAIVTPMAAVASNMDATYEQILSYFDSI